MEKPDVGETDIPAPKPSGGGARIDCTEPGCDNDDAVAIWDDPLLSENLVFVCFPCSNAESSQGVEKVPEFKLWNATRIEENAERALPDQRTTHPLSDDEEWAVTETHHEATEYHDAKTYYEAFVWDVANREAVEVARDEIRRRKSQE